MYDFEKVKMGDKKERNKIIVDNQRLVYTVAKRYINSNIDMDDLIQEGFLGLIRAVELYDYKKDIKFSTYAFYWIRTKIRRFILLNLRSIKYPVYMEEQLIEYCVNYDKFMSLNGREPSNEEMSKILSISIDDIEKVLQLKNSFVSLNGYVGENQDISVEEVIGNGELTPDDVFSQKELVCELGKIFDSGILTEQEVNVIKYRFGFYGEELTLDEIGKKYNVSRERIRQIEQKALRKLRTSSLLDSLVDFADNPDRIKELRKKR